MMSSYIKMRHQLGIEAKSLSLCSLSRASRPKRAGPPKLRTLRHKFALSTLKFFQGTHYLFATMPPSSCAYRPAFKTSRRLLFMHVLGALIVFLYLDVFHKNEP